MTHCCSSEDLLLNLNDKCEFIVQYNVIGLPVAIMCCVLSRAQIAVYTFGVIFADDNFIPNNVQFHTSFFLNNVVCFFNRYVTLDRSIS